MFQTSISKKWDNLLEQDQHRLREADGRLHSSRNDLAKPKRVERNPSRILNKDSCAESLLSDNPIEKIRQKTLALKKKIE